MMRRWMICLLPILYVNLAFAQAATVPQWKVVRAVYLRNQTAAISQTTLVMPSSPGIYRLSAYISVSGNEDWAIQFQGYDVTGQLYNPNITAAPPGSGGWAQLSPVVFSPEPGQPFVYSTFSSGGSSGGSYTFAITVEHLVK